MNILITGAGGFIGKNLCVTLNGIKEGKDKSFAINPDLTLFEFDVDSDPAILDGYCAKADFVFNLAGVNRPKEQEEFMSGNFGFASTLLDTLKKHGNTCPVMLSSSTQAALGNPYGQSKKAGEDLFFQYAKDTGAQVLVYRFPNVFGKWCRPNYNSAVATFDRVATLVKKVKTNKFGVAAAPPPMLKPKELPPEEKKDVLDFLIGLAQDWIAVNARARGLPALD